MKIMELMISNDDGVKSVGIDALAQEAKQMGKVIIVAPDRQQTARAKALTFHRPIRMEDSTTVSGIPAIAYDSPPAVSVIIYEHFYDKPDLVLSGINSGDNTSMHSILTSGTCAVAMEAGMKHIPAISFSMDVPDEYFYSNDVPGGLKIASKIAIQIAMEFIKADKEYWNSFMFLNVNFPRDTNENTKIEFAELETYKYNNYLHERVDPSNRKYFWLWGTKREDFDTGSDSYKIYNEQIITITPVSLNGMDDKEKIHRQTEEMIAKINAC